MDKNQKTMCEVNKQEAIGKKIYQLPLVY